MFLTREGCENGIVFFWSKRDGWQLAVIDWCGLWAVWAVMCCLSYEDLGDDT
jgi:hypothetical protein